MIFAKGLRTIVSLHIFLDTYIYFSNKAFLFIFCKDICDFDYIHVNCFE